MARLFDDASSQSASVASAAITSVPFTMACWFNVDTAAADQGLIRVYNNAVNNQSNQQLMITSAGEVGARTTSSAGTAQTSGISGVSTNTWQHAAGVWSANDSRRAYLNGSIGSNATASLTPSGLNATCLGAFLDTAPDRYLSGMMADAAIWNTNLTSTEIAILASGVSPLAVRPGNLAAYWPLWGVHSPEIDLKGGFHMTLSNGPTKAIHPRMRYLAQTPYPGLFGTFTPGGGGGASSGWMWAG